MRSSLPKLLTPRTSTTSTSIHIRAKNQENLFSNGSIHKDIFQVLCKLKNPKPTRYTNLLNSCKHYESIPYTKLVQAHIIQSGLANRHDLLNKLAFLYATLRKPGIAWKIMEKIPSNASVITWSAVICCHVRSGLSQEAINIYNVMRGEASVSPSNYTFSSILEACYSLGELRMGQKYHQEIITRGFYADVSLGSSLVKIYSSVGEVDDARQVFDEMPTKNVVSWTAMIDGYAKRDSPIDAFSLYCKMQREGTCPNFFTFMAVLPAVVCLGELENAKQIHTHILKRGHFTDIIVGSALVDLYVCLGCFDHALVAFEKLKERNVVSWTIIVSGLAKNGQGDKALNAFLQMENSGIPPSENTFASVLLACSSKLGLLYGKMIHGKVIKKGYDSDVVVDSALVNMYVKGECLEDAQLVFDLLPVKNVMASTTLISGYAKMGNTKKALEFFGKFYSGDAVFWLTMISGFVNNKQFKEALRLFQVMHKKGLMPNSMIFTSILCACSKLGARDNGKEIHANIIVRGLQNDSTVGNSLVNLYAKCCNLEAACRVFERLPTRSTSSWNSMIIAFSNHGYGKKAIRVFNRMVKGGERPNSVTFVGLLSACCHSHLVEDAWRFFNSMWRDYGIAPGLEHYGCMVDLLGRVGHLAEAEQLILNMPMKPDVVSWETLLSACKSYGDTVLAERVVQFMFKLDSGDFSSQPLSSCVQARF